ncbi:MAG: hypothetical protein L6V87_00160 [Ruminococcus sp.]|nr:MAG: hypothetical protein L6V87_00160 [Ruminococcus sp.]
MPGLRRCFSGNSFAGTVNGGYAPDEFFGSFSARLVPMLIGTNTLEERALYAQNYLMQIICADRMNPCLMNTVHDILSSGGREKISALAEKNAVSKKETGTHFQRKKWAYLPKSFFIAGEISEAVAGYVLFGGFLTYLRLW